MSQLSSVPCLIVTLCKSLNYGAYLQSFALKEVLKAYGYEVSFLDIYDQENNKKRYRFLFSGLKKYPVSFFFNFKKLLAFKKAEKQLNIVTREQVANFEAAFIGADEVWSVTNESFVPAPEFFGLGLPNLLKFSYAPSVGSSGVDDVACYPEYMAGLKNFDLLSVRDSESFDVSKKATSRDDIPIILDPTFLYDFSSQEEAINVGRPYVLIYTYGFSEEIIEEVRDYARRNGLALVSAGFYQEWVDINFPCTPFEFLTLVKYAESVITDTFHGAIFSVKYRKNFISYGRYKKKVEYLLESIGLTRCLVDIGYLKKNNTLKTDYSKIDYFLEPLIDESLKYLDRCNSFLKV